MLHRDGLMLVIDKPAGISVHRGPKGGPSLEDWFPLHCATACRAGRNWRTGSTAKPLAALVLGRHRKALASLSLLFKHRLVDKSYWAIVEGGPVEDEGTIDLAARAARSRVGWWMKPDPNGQPAVTTAMGRAVMALNSRRAAAGRGVPHAPRSHAYVARTRTGPPAARINCVVHCAAMGYAIFGDDIYGNEASQRRAKRHQVRAAADAPGLQLHAREIVVPISRAEPVRVTTPATAICMRACGWQVGGARRRCRTQEDVADESVVSLGAARAARTVSRRTACGMCG